jgi:hypothetical protein
MNRDGLLRRQFLPPQLSKQRSEMFRWLQERGMPCPTLVVWGYDDLAGRDTSSCASTRVRSIV